MSTKSQVVLDRPIKAIGVHEVKIALHPEVSVTVKVNVARSPEEADLQAQGVDVMAQMFERDAAAFTEDFDPNAEPGATAEAAAEAPAEAPSEATRGGWRGRAGLGFATADDQEAVAHPGGGLFLAPGGSSQSSFGRSERLGFVPC